LIQQGHCDYPLTEEGENQARTLGKLLQSKAWHRVYCSDLQRARSSAELILSQSDYWNGREDEILLSKHLRELSFGVREGLSRSLNREQALEVKAKQFNIPKEEVVDTAETPLDAKMRQFLFLKQLHSDHIEEFLSLSQQTNLETNLEDDSKTDSTTNFEKHIACVSHGGYIRYFLKFYCNDTYSQKIKNCGTSIITITWTDVNDPESFVCEAQEHEVNLSPLEVNHIP
jgi:broad specificity phosphatase PhoE